MLKLYGQDENGQRRELARGRDPHYLLQALEATGHSGSGLQLELWRGEPREQEPRLVAEGESVLPFLRGLICC
jgi:hypothetical protein